MKKMEMMMRELKELANRIPKLRLGLQKALPLTKLRKVNEQT